uniref:Uncharacterized protein n=1 Tax=Pyrodinium bahamense TaxID=73915 RepID=A0A7S0ABU5_9DINO|mmetsp:Transcript_30923/g.85272  ORF Transcript_30923/g.85272 Transcript_30923/m.85272 type:complete len:145 (+) Transcript_30923:3-437(+)
MIVFVAFTFTGETWSVREEPIVPSFLVLLPIIFAPVILAALCEGAKFNANAKLRLLGAIDDRRSRLISMRDELLVEGSYGQERSLELVQVSFETISHTIRKQQRPQVLIGWAGRGLIVLSYALAVRYVAESLLHAVLVSRCVSF